MIDIVCGDPIDLETRDMIVLELTEADQVVRHAADIPIAEAVIPIACAFPTVAAFLIIVFEFWRLAEPARTQVVGPVQAEAAHSQAVAPPAVTQNALAHLCTLFAYVIFIYWRVY